MINIYKNYYRSIFQLQRERWKMKREKKKLIKFIFFRTLTVNLSHIFIFISMREFMEHFHVDLLLWKSAIPYLSSHTNTRTFKMCNENFSLLFLFFFIHFCCSSIHSSSSSVRIEMNKKKREKERINIDVVKFPLFILLLI